jgi:acyl dehydratase
MKDIYFEDLRPGDVSTFGGMTVTREAIVEFAREFDPQPFHLDEEAARHTFVGRLIASGWHSCAMQMRMVCDGWLLRSSSMGAPGIEEVKWMKPVLPGDTLSIRQTILDAKTSRSRPGSGLVHFRLEMLNGAGEPVMSQTMWVMFGLREPPADAAAPAERSGPAAPAEAATEEPAPERRPARSFDDLVVGRREELGSYTFTPESIIRFAREFDPQPFHVDEAAARTSHFGGLVASGWHTAACWMRSLIAHRARMNAVLAKEGLSKPRFGPSPGFRNLRWLKPVRAGDTLAFASTVADRRASLSRPGWGLVFSHNTGHNQHGELVFSFEGSAFWGRREPTDQNAGSELIAR